MTRIDLIDGDAELSAQARAVADRIVETRGELSRPFQLLLHSPGFAERVAELGHAVRTRSTLTDADRELATLATGVAVACEFVWASHRSTASAAGIPDETVERLRNRRASLDPRQMALVSFVDELCGTGTVSSATFEAARALLGDRGVVDLALTVGYYTMLARVMGAFDAC
ncbi:MAG TPA: carboxymuconolactone decarboxylase family protein [Actinomycetota bacterium]|nr:carboxymuconolactone decarboxylase family protein [Actinomycetota bacterium]